MPRLTGYSTCSAAGTSEILSCARGLWLICIFYLHLISHLYGMTWKGWGCCAPCTVEHFLLKLSILWKIFHWWLSVNWNLSLHLLRFAMKQFPHKYICYQKKKRKERIKADRGWLHPRPNSLRGTLAVNSRMYLWEARERIAFSWIYSAW